jgi:hypothetical protein
MYASRYAERLIRLVSDVSHLIPRMRRRDLIGKRIDDGGA